MKKKLISALLCVSMIAASLVGCGSTASESNGSAAETTETTEATETTEVAEETKGSSEGGQVYWLNFKPEADEALQQIAKDYTDETGVTVKVVTARSNWDNPEHNL